MCLREKSTAHGNRNEGPEEGKMKILFFSQFYTPESIAPSFRATENSIIWKQMGHDVTVFTGYPNYPTGKIFDGYFPKMLSEEEIDGVRVLRSKLIAAPNTNMVKRLENALSYFFFGWINTHFNNSKIGKDYDVVLGTSGIIFNALLAQLYASRKHIPFVFEIRDITYVQMQATGKSPKSKSVKGMKWLELRLCKKASKVVVVTNGFKKTLVADGVPEEKIEVITNVPDSEYLIIGDGAQKAEIEESAKDVSYVRMLPGMSAAELEPYYNNTQLSVITLRKSDNFKHTIPSKLFQVMGRGIAILFIGPDGESAEIIRKYNAGITLTETTDEDMKNLKDFFSKPDWHDQLRQMGDNGRRAVEEQYSRTKLAKDYIKVLDGTRLK